VMMLLDVCCCAYSGPAPAAAMAAEMSASVEIIFLMLLTTAELSKINLKNGRLTRFFT